MTYSESGSFLSDEFVIKMGKQIKNITKQTVEIRPSNSQTQYTNNQRILFQIPYSSTFSTKDLALHFKGQTSGATPAGTAKASTLFPKDMNIFADIIIRINGKIVSSFSNRYNDVAAIMGNLKKSNNAARILLQNGNLRKKQYVDAAGDITTVADMAFTAGTADSLNDTGDYVISQFEGLLGNTASSSFVDSRILGEMTIEFVLAPATVLITGNNTENVATRNAYGGISSFTLENVKLSMQRYNLDSSYYEGIDKNLSSGSTYKIAFDHYDIFSKNATTQQDSVMFNMNAHDIKCMYGFFSHADRDNNAHPVHGFHSDVDDFYNAYWYDYNGLLLDTAQYQVGSTLVPQNPMSPTDCLLELIRMHNLKQDTADERLVKFDSIANFRKHYFVAPLSFEFSEDKSPTKVISGLSSEGLPLAISFNYKLSSAPTNTNANVLVVSTRVLTINNGAVVDVNI
jgi:hypothetical protein